MISVKIFNNYYDDYFSIKKGCLKFISENIRKNDELLIFSKYEKRYISKLRKEGFDISLKNIDIDEIDNEEYGKYKEIVFTGNEMLEVNSKEDIKEHFKKIYNLLKVNGFYIFEISNFERIIEIGKELPQINIIFEDRKINITRQLKIDSNRIYLSIGGYEDDKEVVKTEEVELFYLKKYEIIDILNTVGFEEIEVYASYDKEEFDISKSNSILIRCQKKNNLLKDSEEYEEYTANLLKDEGCSGCNKSKEGHGCSGCNKKCDKGGCCKG